MEFNFGKKLKELRHKKDVTQEELAAHLKISSQAVSKWERDESYPDITLLPRLALYFDVTIDEMLGISDEKMKEDVEEYCEKSQRIMNMGDIDENLKLWEKAYSEYPNNHTVMMHYMEAVYYIFECKGKAHRDKSNIIIELGKKLLERSADNECRESAVQILVYTYSHLGDTETAKKYAQMMTGFCTCRENLMTHILNGEEGIIHRQYFITRLIDSIAMKASGLAYEDCYTAEEKIKICHYVLSLYSSLFVDGDYGFYYCRMSQYSEILSRKYAEIKDRDNCIKYLKDASEYATRFENLGKETIKHTSLLVNKTEDDPSGFWTTGTDNRCKNILLLSKNTVYDFVREDKEFIEIQKELERRAN